MYLYIPLSGRTVNVESYSISSTGIQFDEPVPCLDAVLGTLLRLETEETKPEPIIEPVIEPVIEPIIEPEPQLEVEPVIEFTK